MRQVPKNKYSLLALVWFAVCWYGILRESTSNAPPPFPHFDKAAHCGMFFVLVWLAARSFLEERKLPPYPALLVFAALFAVCSELAQLWFTRTRSAEIADGMADLSGAVLALLLAKNVAANRRIESGGLSEKTPQ